MLTSECLCTHLRRAARGVTRHYDEALAGFGVNVAQFSLLRHLQRLDRPSITTLAEGDDQRNREVLLTAAGTQLLQAAHPAWEQAQTDLVERLGSGQRDQLVHLLNQLA